MRTKRRLKKQIKKFLLKILIILTFAIFCFSMYKIVNWFIDSREISKQMELIDKKSEVKEIEDSEDTEIIKPTNDLEPSDPYWDYIKMKLINVDFKDLKTINKYTVGWIQVGGTSINYPFVKGYDNGHFLYNDFYDKKNSAGWIFMDYRNNAKSFDKNTIIYGHARLETIMFGTLENILTEQWLNNKDNHVIKLSTEKENTLWQIFSVYHIPKTSDYLEVDFESQNEYNNFLKKIKKRTIIDFNTNVNVADKILTLSTCHKDNERLVVHAKLIKSTKR